jgi:hypothetical protein
VLAASSGAAAVLTLMVERRTVYQNMLFTTCSGVYLLYLFVSGSRFLMISFLAALFIARAQRSRISWAPMVLLILAAVPFSAWYAYSIRQKLSLGSSEGSIGGNSAASAVRSVVDPFVEGGLDSLRTLGVTVARPEFLSANWEGAIGGLLTLVPRAVWPDKPYGVSIAFSKYYFPDRWAEGTGVPPSLPAELVFYFGLTIAPLLLIAAGYSIGRVGRRIWTSTSLWVRVLGPLLTVDTVVLVKSGSDSFLRLIVIHGVGVFLVCAGAAHFKLKLLTRDERLERSGGLHQASLRAEGGMVLPSSETMR